MIIAPKRWRQFVIPLENGIIISHIGSISLDGNDDDDDDDDNGCCIGPLKQFFTHSHLQCNPQKLSRPIRACIDLPANRVRQRPPPPPWQNKLEYLKTGDVGSVLNRHSRRRRCLCPVTLTPCLLPMLVFKWNMLLHRFISGVLFPPSIVGTRGFGSNGRSSKGQRSCGVRWEFWKWADLNLHSLSPCQTSSSHPPASFEENFVRWSRFPSNLFWSSLGGGYSAAVWAKGEG